MGRPDGGEGDAEDIQGEERDGLEREVCRGCGGVEVEVFDDLGEAGGVGCEAAGAVRMG